MILAGTFPEKATFFLNKKSSPLHALDDPPYRPNRCFECIPTASFMCCNNKSCHILMMITVPS